MRALTSFLLAAVLVGCAVPPKPANIVAGEGCWRCKQPIRDAKLAAELVADSGFAQKFRTIRCMSTWVAQQKEVPAGSFYVADYSTGKWIRAERASFVRTIVSRDTMAIDYLAFLDEDAAERAAAEATTKIENWEQVLALGRSNPIGGD
jgi:copper chaperone NosL